MMAGTSVVVDQVNEIDNLLMVLNRPGITETITTAELTDLVDRILATISAASAIIAGSNVFSG